MITQETKFISFKEVIDLLEQGKAVARKSWGGNIFAVKQIESIIPSHVIPNMTSLSNDTKTLLAQKENRSIHYINQCLIIILDENEARATYYMPTWDDIFATDWYVVE